MSATIVHTADQAQRERHADCMARIAADQSREAFAELFAFFAPRLKAYMLRLGAAESEARRVDAGRDDDGLAQAVMYDRKQASVSTWIFRVARNARSMSSGARPNRR